MRDHFWTPLRDRRLRDCSAPHGVLFVVVVVAVLVVVVIVVALRFVFSILLFTVS